MLGLDPDFPQRLFQNLFVAPTPSDPVPDARALVAGDDAARERVDIGQLFTDLAKGALSGVISVVANKAAATPEVRQAVVEKGQLEVGKVLTQPAVLLGLGVGAVLLVVLLVRR